MIQGIYSIEDINKAVLSLSLQERILIGLSLAGYSNEKIGQKIGTSPQTAKKRLKSAKKQLQYNLKGLVLLERKKKKVGIILPLKQQ